MEKEPRRQGRPTREEAAEIADRVLTQARAVFCEQGIAGASMDDIAVASGVTKHTIYRRYPSKMALVDAVVERDLRQLTDAIDAVARDSDAVSALRETALRYFRFSIDPADASFASFLLAEAAYSEEMRDNLKRWNELYLAPMIALVETAQREGRMAAGPPRKWCVLLADLISGVNRLHRISEPDIFFGDSAETFFEERWQIFGQAAGLQGDGGPAEILTEPFVLGGAG